MKGFRLNLKIGFLNNLIDLIFSLAEDYAPSVSSAVNVYDVLHQWNDVLVLDVHGTVGNCFRGLDFGVFDEVDHFPLFLHVPGGDSFDPDGDGG